MTYRGVRKLGVKDFDLRSVFARWRVSSMKAHPRLRRTACAVVACATVWLPLSAALAKPPRSARATLDPQQELERKQQERFEEQLRRAREADRVREAERVRRTREAQERATQTVQRTRESREAARVRDQREAESLQAAREADRARTRERSRLRRDRNLPPTR